MPGLVAASLYFLFAGGSIALLVWQSSAMQWRENVLPRAAIAAICAAAYFLGPSINGLEYEDAYVGKAAALWLAEHSGETADGFYSSVCLAGRVGDCVVEATFGTQLIGYASLIAISHLAFGEYSHAGNVISAIAAALTLQILWSLLTRYASTLSGRWISIGLFLSGAYVHLLSASGFAEPLFSFFLMAHLSLYLALVLEQDARSTTNRLSWVLFVVSGALMVMVKKEGALLVLGILAFATVHLTLAYISTKKIPIRPLAIGAVSISILIFAHFVLRIGDAAARHEADIGEAAFQFSNLPKLLPVIFAAAMTPKYFGLLWACVAIATPLALYLRDKVALQLAAIIVAYALIYSLHARHQFYVRGASVSPSEMVRYIYVLAPVGALLVGRVIAQVQERIKIIRVETLAISWRWVVGSVFVCGLVWTGAVLRDERRNMAADEYRSRTGMLGDEIEQSDAIYISPRAVALTAVAGKDVFVLDVRVLQNPAVQDWLKRSRKEGQMIVIDRQLCGERTDLALSALCDKSLKRP